MKAFDEFKNDFYSLWGLTGKSVEEIKTTLKDLYLLSPTRIRKLKVDNVDGGQWNNCEHLNNKNNGNR